MDFIMNISSMNTKEIMKNILSQMKYIQTMLSDQSILHNLYILMVQYTIPMTWKHILQLWLKNNSVCTNVK